MWQLVGISLGSAILMGISGQRCATWRQHCTSWILDNAWSIVIGPNWNPRNNCPPPIHNELYACLVIQVSARGSSSTCQPSKQIRLEQIRPDPYGRTNMYNQRHNRIIGRDQTEELENEDGDTQNVGLRMNTEGVSYKGHLSSYEEGGKFNWTLSHA